MSLPGPRDSGVGIPSIFSLFPPAKSSSGSTSLSNGDLPVPNFSPSISSFFPPNNSPSSSESAPVKQSSPSISLLFPPTHSQSNSLSSTRAIHEIANSICSIFRPNCSYSSSSESSHDQVTSRRKKLDHELEDVASSYIETQLIKAREHQQQQQQPQQPQHQQQQHGFTFNEVSSVRASTSKVVCCHFSSNGKLLASGGHDKKAVLWYTDTLKPKATLEGHSALITDVRFSPLRSRLATSSFDKTIRVWDPYYPDYSLRTFTGHSSVVMSLDFHPNKDDLICSCDGDGETRYWSINHGICLRVFKGGTAQMRFQPRFGRYLAAAAENVLSILDVETLACRHTLQGHTNSIHSVCWDPSGEFLASVSEDSVRVWALGSGSGGECIHVLRYNGNKFCSCVFHPIYSTLLVIGCYQSLELWNMPENKIMTLSVHDGLIAALAVSTVTCLVASASHDKFVKLWK